MAPAARPDGGSEKAAVISGERMVDDNQARPARRNMIEPLNPVIMIPGKALHKGVGDVDNVHHGGPIRMCSVDNNLVPHLPAKANRDKPQRTTTLSANSSCSLIFPSNHGAR